MTSIIEVNRHLGLYLRCITDPDDNRKGYFKCRLVSRVYPDMKFLIYLSSSRLNKTQEPREEVEITVVNKRVYYLQYGMTGDLTLIEILYLELDKATNTLARIN